ncbi:MAG: ABC transporter permease [Candidatus Methanomarinus sp.]|uniref:ABC transporter permease n=1 Tax=Candidatus Methanomarinus sp. TaxID=3386244 RepID=A0AC61S946_9EURY|nr:MAG: ABC transporter permease [ANME-2 cluster archaeon]
MATKRTPIVHRKGLEILSLLAVAIIWQFIAVVIVKNDIFLPPFTDVLFSFFEVITDVSAFYKDLSTSLLHFSIGLFFALIIGIPVGIIMGWFKAVNRAVDPLIEILRPIPPLAWIPIAIIWLGFTHLSAGFIIFIGAVFPIIINTFTGFKGVPLVYVEAGKVLGCIRDRDLIWYVALPSATPSIAAGIRIAMGVGWMCLVAAEYFGVSSNGIGYKLWFHYGIHEMNFVIVYMLLLGFIGLIIDRLFRYYIDRRLLKWQSGVVL